MLETTIGSFSTRVLRRRAINTRLTVRSLTSERRLLPDFLVIGAQRSGTGSLYKYLSAHPCVTPSIRKETGYFSRWYEKGFGWYQSHFPLQARRQFALRVRGKGLTTFEATPDYLFHPLAAARIAHRLPDVKLIVLLRNPVERAMSHYAHRVRLGLETLSFEEAIEREPERLAGEVKRILNDPAHDCKRYLGVSYVSRGMYADQLGLWMSFFARDRFIVIESTDLFSRPGEVYPLVLSFLGLPQWTPGAFENHSYPKGAKPARPDVHDRARRILAEQFAPHNRRLYKLLDRDFEWEDTAVGLERV